MRHRWIVLHLGLLLLLPVSSRAGAPARDNVATSQTVTFEEAVRIALANGRDVRLAAQDVRIASQGKAVASSGYLPRLDAGADYTALSETPETFFNGIPVQVADKNIWRARLTAEQTIYDFGRTRGLVGQAGARTDVAKRLEGLTRERQALDAIAAFLEARRAEALRKVAQESLATANDHRRLAQDRFDVGKAARSDVYAADVRAANAEAELISAEVRVEISRSRLALRMGYEGDRSVTPAPGPFPAPAGEPPPLSQSLRVALEKREELRAQDATIREGEAAADAARAGFAPTFFGQGGWSYEANDLNPHRSVYSILLGGRVNLFSGFADEASLRQARLDVGRRKEALGKLRDEIALEVKSAHLLVAEAAKRIAVAEAAVVNAGENLRIQDDRYQEGMAISTEVLDAQAFLTRARTDRENAVYDLAEARFRLLAARGELLDFLGQRVTAGR